MFSMIIAYGGFSDSLFEDAFKILAMVFPVFLLTWGGVVGVCFLGRKSVRYMVYSILAYLFLMGLSLPMFSVMGEYGPAHIASEIVWVNMIVAAMCVITVPWVNYFKGKCNKQ